VIIELFCTILSWSEKIKISMTDIYLEYNFYFYFCLIILLSFFGMAQINLYYFVEKTKEKRWKQQFIWIAHKRQLQGYRVEMDKGKFLDEKEIWGDAEQESRICTCISRSTDTKSHFLIRELNVTVATSLNHLKYE